MPRPLSAKRRGRCEQADRCAARGLAVMLRNTNRCAMLGRMGPTVAPLTRAKIQRLADELSGQSRLAQLLGVDRSRITRWLGGEMPDAVNSAKLDALEYVTARLLRTFPAPTAHKWLTGINAALGNRRPVDLLGQGRVAEVIAAIEQVELDSYA